MIYKNCKEDQSFWIGLLCGLEERDSPLANAGKLCYHYSRGGKSYV